MSTQEKILVSIIVTTKNNEATIDACLKSIAEQTYQSREIIVVDNNSRDRTVDISAKYTSQIFNIGPERSAQRNHGAKISKGDYLLFIDSDMELQSKLIQESVDIFESDSNVASLFIPEETMAEGFWGRCKKFERDFYLVGEPSVEAVRFFRRSVFFALGGYDEEQTGTEDWDLSDRTIAKYTVARTQARIVHNEGFVDLGEQVKKKRYYSRQGVTRYMKTAPKYRRSVYPFKPSVFKQWRLFLTNPIYGFGSILLKAGELISMAA